MARGPQVALWQKFGGSFAQVISEISLCNLKSSKLKYKNMNRNQKQIKFLESIGIINNLKTNKYYLLLF